MTSRRHRLALRNAQVTQGRSQTSIYEEPQWTDQAPKVEVRTPRRGRGLERGLDPESCLLFDLKMEHFDAVFKLDLTEETRTQLQEKEAIAIAPSCAYMRQPRCSDNFHNPDLIKSLYGKHFSHHTRLVSPPVRDVLIISANTDRVDFFIGLLIIVLMCHC